MTIPGTDAARDLANQLKRIPSSTATVILQELGIAPVVMRHIRPLVPLLGSAVGPARTLRFLPARSDVPKPPHGNVNRRLVDTLRAGEFLAIDAGGHTEGAVLGDMMAGRAAFRGAAGVVADGVMRDTAGIAALGLPVFARGAHPAPNAFTLLPWETDVPIQCGGVLVRPGDWILGDADAVIVIPATRIGDVAERGALVSQEEEFCALLLAAGFPLDEAYPLPASRHAAFEQFKQNRFVPTYDGA